MNARCSRRALALATSVIVMTVLLVWGCNEGVHVTGADPPEPPVPDLVEESSRARAALYDPWNAFTVSTVQRLLERADVAAAVDELEGRGMRLLPEDCVVVEGTDGPVGARVTFITMTPQDGGGDMGVVACFERGDRLVVSPGILSVAPATGTRSAARELAPGLWTHALPPRSPQRWSPEQWTQFWQCLLVYAPGPVTTCMVGCYFAGPGYMHCVMACTVTQALSAVVRCAAAVIVSTDSGRDIEVE